MPNQRATTLGREGRVSRSTQSRVCHAAASTATPQLASQAALERRPDLLRTHMPEWSSVGVPQRRWNRRLWRRLARAAEAVAGRPVDGPISHWECDELLGAGRRAPRRCGSRAGALPCGSRRRGTPSTRGTQPLLLRAARLWRGSRARCVSTLPVHGVGGSLTVRACRLAAGCTCTSPRRRRRRRSRRSSPSMRRRTCTCVRGSG